MWLGREPASFTFDEGENGKPYLPDRALEFNLSHAGRWALIALGRAELGVDVERTGRVTASEGVLEIAFGEAVHVLLWVVLGLCTLFVTRIMYTVLTQYSGAKPAEFYSAQKRPDYAEYQRTTHRFFPGPRRG